MKNIPSNKILSFTERRNSTEVLVYTGDSPVTILNQNKVSGYVTPKATVTQINFEKIGREHLRNTLKESKKEVQSVLDYLRDK